MRILLLGSVSGSPGVTTTAVALTQAWPRPVVLVEAAADGSSAVLSGYLAGRVPHTHGILDAAVAARSGTLTQTLPGLLTNLPPSPRASLLAGLARPEQATTLAASWPLLADALADAARALRVDVIVDAGRVSQLGAPLPALAIADRVLLATGSDLRSLHALRSWLPTLSDQLVDPSRLGALVIGEGHPYTAREIRRHLDLEVAGVIDHDPAGAQPWSHGTPTTRRPTPYGRSINALLPTLTDAATHRPDTETVARDVDSVLGGVR